MTGVPLAVVPFMYLYGSHEFRSIICSSQRGIRIKQHVLDLVREYAIVRSDGAYCLFEVNATEDSMVGNSAWLVWHMKNLCDVLGVAV